MLALTSASAVFLGLLFVFSHAMGLSWRALAAPGVAGAIYGGGIAALSRVEHRSGGRLPGGRWWWSAFPVFGAVAGIAAALVSGPGGHWRQYSIYGAVLGALHLAIGRRR